MGVALVCIIDLTREENNFLIECKLINVDTGLAMSKSEIASDVTNAEIKKASDTAVKKLMGRGAMTIADGPAAVETAHDRHQAAAHHAAPVEAAAHDRGETKTTQTVPAHLRNIGKDRPRVDFGCFGGISAASQTGDIIKLFDEMGYGDLNFGKLGFGASLAAEWKYFRVRTEGTYFAKALHSFYSFSLAAEGVYRFGPFDESFYVFAGVAGTTCCLKLDDVKIPSMRVTGNGVGISGGFGYNFNDTYGIEASYTSAANVASYPVPKTPNITQSINLELIQVSFRYRF